MGLLQLFDFMMAELCAVCTRLMPGKAHSCARTDRPAGARAARVESLPPFPASPGQRREIFGISSTSMRPFFM